MPCRPPQPCLPFPELEPDPDWEAWKRKHAQAKDWRRGRPAKECERYWPELLN